MTLEPFEIRFPRLQTRLLLTSHASQQSKGQLWSETKQADQEI
jgi:hypothetical protein